MSHRRAAAPAARGRPRPRPRTPRARTSTPTRWAWLLDDRTLGQPTTVHTEGCLKATDRAHPLGTTQALYVLARPSTTATACTVCDAAEAQMPILTHGQEDDVPPATDHRAMPVGCSPVRASASRAATSTPPQTSGREWLLGAVALNGGGEP
ncbi:DUF6233 domain-containing protein [Streptomyces sp. NPDC059072]|uniref:DUF6233 domain-containing protein n=1 Tax=Streptomyces sp. NPDC059072 TaxID=3346715 RepID=UPI0036B86AE4